MSSTITPVRVVLDGPDGVGISTQRDRLTAYLSERGIPCLPTAEPSEGPAGLLLREMLFHRTRALAPSAMQRLFVADRDDHHQLVVAPALARGEVVVQARGEWSTVVYNAARGASLTEAEELAVEAFEWHDGFAIPTLTILLIADLEVTEARRHKRIGAVELFDGSDFQARVISLYSEADRLADLDPSERYVKDIGGRDRLAILDASGSEAEVFELMIEAIEGAGILPHLFGGAL